MIRNISSTRSESKTTSEGFRIRLYSHRPILHFAREVSYLRQVCPCRGSRDRSGFATGLATEVLCEVPTHEVERLSGIYESAGTYQKRLSTAASKLAHVHLSGSRQGLVGLWPFLRN